MSKEKGPLENPEVLSSDILLQIDFQAINRLQQNYDQFMVRIKERAKKEGSAGISEEEAKKLIKLRDRLEEADEWLRDMMAERGWETVDESRETGRKENIN